MIEWSVRTALMKMRGAVTQLGLYPGDHPAVEEAVRHAAKAADDLIGAYGDVVLTVIGDSLYLDRKLLAHASLEFHGFIRRLQASGIDSLSLSGHISQGDVVDLASLLAGRTGDVPAEGTIRLNTSPFSVSGSAIRRADVRAAHQLRAVARRFAGHRNGGRRQPGIRPQRSAAWSSRICWSRRFHSLARQCCFRR